MIQKSNNKFLAPLSGNVQFCVWIDILAKEKFANLSNKFLLLFSFLSYLYFVYFFFFSFLLYFSFRC